MPPEDNRSRKSRSYPALYEKLIPAALAIIVVATAIVIIIALVVVLRSAPGITY